MKRVLILAATVVLAIAFVTITSIAMEANSPTGPNQADARLAIAHLAPFAMDPGTAVTVTLDGTPVLTDFAFVESTGYLTVPAGLHQVQVYASGSASPAISATVDLITDTDYTAIAVGGANGWDLGLLPLVDDNSAPAAGNAKVRFGHLAPFAATITDTLADIRLQDGTLVDPALDDVPYGAVAPYLELPAGEYDLKITTADGGTTLIDPMPVTLNDGDILSVFAVGDGANQSVGAFALPSGVEGFLLTLAANVQIAHLAPFAMDPGTAVTVTLDGTPVLTDFEFADSTAYLPVPEGPHLVEVYPAGSPTPAISGTVILTQAMDYTAIAVGGANGWDLGLLPLVDDNSAPAAGNAKVRFGHLAPFAATITDTLADIRLQDGTLVDPALDDVPYGAVAPYLELPAGEYDLKITTADGGTTLIDPMPVTLNDGDILSVFAVGDGANQSVGAFALPSGVEGFLLTLAANVQIAHLAPFAMDPGTAVTVTLDGTPVLTDFEFADSTAYLPVPEGPHLVEVYPAGSVTPAISGTVILTQAMDYTAIAVGGANGWDLGLLPLVDDNSAPAAGNAKVRFGHLAPFAATITDTLADIRLQDGTLVDPALDDVPYGAVAPYLELPAGQYDLKITTADGGTTLIDPMPVTLNDGDILSVFAVGDGANQSVGAFALPSGVEGFLLPLTVRILYMSVVFR